MSIVAEFAQQEIREAIVFYSLRGWDWITVVSFLCHKYWSGDMDAEAWRRCKPGDVIRTTNTVFDVTEVVDGHVWGTVRDLTIGECCRICCSMRRRDRKNKPCKGAHKLSLRKDGAE